MASRRQPAVSLSWSLRAAVSIATVLLASGCGGGGTTPSAPRATTAAHSATAPHRAEPPATPVTLRLSRRHLGTISATLTGPPGARVSLSEVRHGRSHLVATIRLSASGRAELSHAGVWSCDRRRRTFDAALRGPAHGAGASATVSTPSCARRLAVRLGGNPVAGGALTIDLRDRWQLGGVPATVCVTPPAGSAACQDDALTRGTPEREIPVDLPRPGRWTVAVQTPDGHPLGRAVWVTQPGGLSLLAAGDSEMQVLDTYLAQDLAPYGVHVSSDAQQSTGMFNEQGLDWQHEASLDASRFAPSVTVMFMGANDGYPINTAGGQVPCCGPTWSQLYAEPVAELTQTLLRGDAGRVYWILLPAPEPASFQQIFSGVDLGIQEAAAHFPGRVGTIDLSSVLGSGPTASLDGQTFQVHESDGVHLSAASDQVVAQLVLSRLRADGIIR